MPLTRISLAVLLATAALAPGGAAAGSDDPAWRIDAGRLKPAKPRPAGPKPPALSREEAERAARLAEARRRFFENKTDDDRAGHGGDFGGYNYKTDSGTLKPGAMFKF